MSSSNVGEVFVRCIPLVTGVHYTLIRVLWSKASFSVLWIARASMGIRSGWRGGAANQLHERLLVPVIRSFTRRMESVSICTNAL